MANPVPPPLRRQPGTGGGETNAGHSKRHVVVVGHKRRIAIGKRTEKDSSKHQDVVPVIEEKHAMLARVGSMAQEAPKWTRALDGIKRYAGSSAAFFLQHSHFFH